MKTTLQATTPPSPPPLAAVLHSNRAAAAGAAGDAAADLATARAVTALAPAWPNAWLRQVGTAAREGGAAGAASAGRAGLARRRSCRAGGRPLSWPPLAPPSTPPPWPPRCGVTSKGNLTLRSVALPGLCARTEAWRTHSSHVCVAYVGWGAGRSREERGEEAHPNHHHLPCFFPSFFHATHAHAQGRTTLTDHSPRPTTGTPDALNPRVACVRLVGAVHMHVFFLHPSCPPLPQPSSHEVAHAFSPSTLTPSLPPPTDNRSSLFDRGPCPGRCRKRSFS
jgi:hypothetical protein